MAVYTVHEPPPRGAAAPDPERFVFVRDGFSFWALLLGPIWMLWHRMWVVLLGYGLVVAVLGWVLRATHVPASVALLVSALLALLIGFEAATLRRFTLARRGFANVGVVVGDDLELAERRFFDVWIRRHADEDAPRGETPAGTVRLAQPRDDVLGLFPEPGAPP